MLTRRMAIAMAAASVCLLGAGPVQAVREAREEPVEGAADADAGGDFAASRLLRRAQDLLLASESERGVRMIETVIEQYPGSDVRYQAYLALGKHFADKFEPAQAIVYFGRIKELEARDSLSPELKDLFVESLYLTGVAQFKMRQYDKAFPVLRKIAADYANTVWANQSYYYIGMCHFALERWNQAIDALSLVGTYVDPNADGTDFVEAGRRLYVKVSDGDLSILYGLGNEVAVTVKATSGDQEAIRCIPLSSDATVFIGSIPTRPGLAVTNDAVLQLIGGDKVQVAYSDVNTQAGEKDIPRLKDVRVVSSGDVFFSLGDGETRAKSGFVGQPVHVALSDVDLDVSPRADKATVRIVSRYRAEPDEAEERNEGKGEGFAQFLEAEETYRVRDELVLELVETDTNAVVRSGRFVGAFDTVAVAADAEVDKADAVLACQEGDELVAVYIDVLHAGGEVNREVTARVPVGGAIDTHPTASQSVVFDATVRARKDIVEAQAYLELARIFNDMGLRDGAGQNADEGLARVSGIIGTQESIDPTLKEQAFKLKWELHMAKRDYDAAIATCRAFNTLFPDSAFVDQALLGIGRIKLEAKSYDEAIVVFNQILALKTSLAKAEAQFLIATCIEAQEGGIEQAIGHYSLCAERYPDSAFAGPSLARLIDYHVDTKDFARASDLLAQVFQDYPDAEFLDAMLLKWVIVAFRVGDFRVAHEKCSTLIFQYPGSKHAVKAKELLPTIEEKL